MSDGTIAAPASGAGGQPPPMPAVPASELYRGSPRLLRDVGVRHSIGWQDHRSAGPGFVVVRMARLGGIKVLSRFPLTPDGWESAWHTLAGLDADAATAISATLAARAEQRRLAELDSGSVRLRSMTYDGGSGGAPLTPGQAYDLRFSDDRLTICLPYSRTAVTEVAYHDVDAAEVDRSGRGRSGGETVAVVLAVALGGALLGLVILGLLGLFLGAMLFALIAGAAMASANTTNAILRLRGPDSEFVLLQGRPGLRGTADSAVSALDGHRQRPGRLAADPGRARTAARGIHCRATDQARRVAGRRPALAGRAGQGQDHRAALDTQVMA